MPDSPTPTPEEEFARQASQRPPGMWEEFAAFLAQNTKWWLTPIIVVLLLVGVLVVLGSSSLAPFIYPLF